MTHDQPARAWRRIIAARVPINPPPGGGGVFGDPALWAAQLVDAGPRLERRPQGTAMLTKRASPPAAFLASVLAVMPVFLTLAARSREGRSRGRRSFPLASRDRLRRRSARGRAPRPASLYGLSQLSRRRRLNGGKGRGLIRWEGAGTMERRSPCSGFPTRRATFPSTSGVRAPAAWR